MTEILIYGIVGDSWDGLDAKTLVPLISEGDDEIVLRINSPGGYVMEGLAIFNALARAKQGGRKVMVHIDGLAASMASTIAMVGDEVLIADNALMMIHNPWDCACGDANELRRAADKLDVIRNQLVKIYAGRTGLDAAALIAMLDAETWLTSEEALAQNFVTGITPSIEVAACDVKAFGFRHAPTESPRITAMGMSRTLPAPAGAKDNGTAPAVPPKQKENAMPQANKAGNDGQPTTPEPVVLTAADIQAAVKIERERVSGIRALGKKHNLPDDTVEELISTEATLASAREKALDHLATQGDAANVGHNSPARVTIDARDKFREGATNWLLVKAGVAHLVEKAAKARGETVKIDPGEFRGVRNVDLARESLANMGVNVTSRDPDAIVRAAMTAQGAVITQTTSDFPLLFENAIHRTLQAAYATTPDTWSRFAGTGTVMDFRAHTRYLRGTFGALDQVREGGEFRDKPIPDLAKEMITAKTVGNMINLSRQAIVNDDMDVFSGLAVDLGRAAKLTIEVDVYALLNANPNMNDGQPLFSEAHGNLAAAGAVPSVAAFDAIDVAMANQKDLSGNEFLEIAPNVLLVPRNLRGAVTTINGSEYDPDAVSKLQKPNIVKGLFSDIVASPRLTGTAYYAFADPMVSPTIEVVFLNGVTEPFTDSQDGWRTDGVEWKVRHDYGVGAVNWRSGYKQPGA